MHKPRRERKYIRPKGTGGKADNRSIRRTIQEERRAKERNEGLGIGSQSSIQRARVLKLDAASGDQAGGKEKRRLSAGMAERSVRDKGKGGRVC
jgi:hypothetical protein